MKLKEKFKKISSFLLTLSLATQIASVAKVQEVNAEGGYWVKYENYSTVHLNNIKSYGQPNNLNLYTVSNGRETLPAYCVEPGVHSLRGSYNKLTALQYGIPDESKNIYGRMDHLAHSLNPNKSSAESRAAAQVAIWMHRASASGYSSGHKFPNDIDPNNLLKMAYAWNTPPKFKPNPAYDEKTNTVKLKKGDTVVLEEKSELPIFFEAKLKKEFPELDVKFERNKIRITAKNNITRPFTLETIKHNGSGVNISLFAHPTSQDVMFVKGIDPADFRLNIKPEGGSIRFIKHNWTSTEALSGGKFRLYKYDNGGKEVNVKKVTGQQGKYIYNGTATNDIIEADKINDIYISNLPPGKYYIKELMPPDGYVLDTAHDNSNQVNVEAGKISQIVMKNKEIRDAEINILKVDQDT